MPDIDPGLGWLLLLAWEISVALPIADGSLPTFDGSVSGTESILEPAIIDCFGILWLEAHACDLSSYFVQGWHPFGAPCLPVAVFNGLLYLREELLSLVEWFPLHILGLVRTINGSRLRARLREGMPFHPSPQASFLPLRKEKSCAYYTRALHSSRLSKTMALSGASKGAGCDPGRSSGDGSWAVPSWLISWLSDWFPAPED